MPPPIFTSAGLAQAVTAPAPPARIAAVMASIPAALVHRHG
jgi:hypothetical protein